MQIQYLGLSCFRITTKDAVVFFDPYGKESGFPQPRGNADIVILSEAKNELYSGTSSLSGEPFIIDSPGEYDKKGVTIAGLPIKHQNGFINVWLLESEGIKILNLSHINNFSLSEDELSSLGTIDILLVPVGGEGVLEASQAAKITNQIEPAVSIPSHFATPGCKVKLDGPESYLKELGNKYEKMEKLLAKKKDFQGSESIKIILLETNK